MATKPKITRAQAAEELRASQEALKAESGAVTTRKVVGICAAIVCSIAGVAAGVAAGNSLAALAATATGSMFLTYFVYYLSCLLISLLGMALGFFAQAAVLDGGIAKKVTGWFGKRAIN